MPFVFSGPRTCETFYAAILQRPSQSLRYTSTRGVSSLVQFLDPRIPPIRPRICCGFYTANGAHGAEISIESIFKASCQATSSKDPGRGRSPRPVMAAGEVTRAQQSPSAKEAQDAVA